MKHTSVQKIKLIYLLGDTAKCAELGPIIPSQDLRSLILVSWTLHAFLHHFAIFKLLKLNCFKKYSELTKALRIIL